MQGHIKTLASKDARICTCNTKGIVFIELKGGNLLFTFIDVMLLSGCQATDRATKE